ncbi:MAG: histidine kinase dimerization/phospho-acceptor domain-containing protein, partial [Myxococcota bacterium]
MLDLQSVLAAAVGRLEQTIGCESAAAWALRENGEPYVAAACFTGTPPSEPVREVFDALAALRGPADLRDADHPKELRRLAGHLGYSAATPVAAADGTPLAVLLVGVDGRDDPRHTARALAALEAARRRLESPLAAALAMGRLCALDAEVQRLDRLALLGRMASEIAHEIRNPLVSIKTFLQLLPERRNDPEFFARFLDIATEEMRRVERLLDLVIGHARPAQSGGEEGACSVGAVLASVSEFVDHLATKRSIDLTCDAGDALPEVQLADDALRQVILNLALNAIQASPDGGAVRIRARADGAGVAISVRDTGPGVPADARSRI